MTPQERQLVDDVFDRLAKLETAPRDPEAAAAIAEGLRRAPNAVYALVQTALLQDEALKRANARIQELEQVHPPEQNQSGGFLDSMRDTIYGQGGQRGSVPNVPPPASRPVWNSGQVMQQAGYPGQYDQGPHGQGSYGQSPYGQGSSGQGSFGQGSFGQSYGTPPFGGGSSFLGTAAAAAAGAVGGSLLLNGIRSMMGGQNQSFAGTGAAGDRAASPWSDQSDSALARDAGIDHIGQGGGRSDDNSSVGLLDQASDSDQDDHDDADLDADDFGSDGGSDYA
jgi:uncharacterized protein